MNSIEIINILKEFFSLIAKLSLCLYFFVPIYTVLGFFLTKKFPKAKHNHKYAIMIAARNEEAVIANLIESINAQDYPKELVTTFVVADNCTDNTAQIARSYGAVCYERFDTEHCTKGYALEFLVDNIKNDYGIESFDAYFIFDADNLLKKDYITRMNEAFDSGEKIVTSYRNTKNFGDNPISSSYGIHWLRTIRYEHRGRSSLGLATRVQGTGFMFSAEVIKNGWHYVSFTEDRAFAADAVVEGYRISYCDRAEFYDEQPTTLRIALRQRIRWGKGHLDAFRELGPKLLKNTFFSTSLPKCEFSTNDLSVCDNTCDDIYNDAKNLLRLSPDFSFFKNLLKLIFLLPSLVFFIIASILKLFARFINILCRAIKKSYLYSLLHNTKFFKGLKQRFMSYDMFIITFPNNLISISSLILCLIADVVLSLVTGNAAIGLSVAFKALIVSVALRWIGRMCLGIYVFFIERKRIMHINFFKKIFYIFLWPMFDIIGEFAVLSALFMHVEWKPIPHTKSLTIDDISSKTN